MWIFLYGKGLWWEMMDFLRLLSAKVPRQRTQHVMQLMGYASNRIFKFMDSLHVPIIESYSAGQMQRMLKRAGFAGLQQYPVVWICLIFVASTNCCGTGSRTPNSDGGRGNCDICVRSRFRLSFRK